MPAQVHRQPAPAMLRDRLQRRRRLGRAQINQPGRQARLGQIHFRADVKTDFNPAFPWPRIITFKLDLPASGRGGRRRGRRIRALPPWVMIKRKFQSGIRPRHARRQEQRAQRMAGATVHSASLFQKSCQEWSGWNPPLHKRAISQIWDEQLPHRPRRLKPAQPIRFCAHLVPWIEAHTAIGNETWFRAIGIRNIPCPACRRNGPPGGIHPNPAPRASRTG